MASWTVFGLRASPDEEIVFVGHRRGEFVVKPGRNKALDAWLADNPGREEVPLGEAPDRGAAARMAAEIVRKAKPPLQRKRGHRANRRANRDGAPPKPPGGAKAAKAAKAAPHAASDQGCISDPQGLKHSPRSSEFTSRRALERALAAAGWTLEEEIEILAGIARDGLHTRQLDAMALLAKRRAEAVEESVEDDAGLSAAAALHGGLDDGGAGADGGGAGGGGEGRRGAGEADEGDRGRVQGERQRGPAPGGGGGPPEHQAGEGGGREGEVFGWTAPTEAVPGFPGGL